MKLAGCVGIALVAAEAMLGCGARAPSQHISQTPQPEIKPAPPTPIAEKKAEVGAETWDPAWDAEIERALPAELVSNRVARDVKPFCPNFKAMSDVDRRTFWAYFFQALAGAEAGLNPATDVRHTEPKVAVKDDVTHRMVRSEGLLQLTYMDADRYGCAFDWERDKALPEHDPAKTILQPENNLRCGVKILDNQLIAKHMPLLTARSYWSTLRPVGPSYRAFAKQMANVPAACRVTPNKKRSAARMVAASRAAAVPVAAAR
jgi:hypothetical protein